MYMRNGVRRPRSLLFAWLCTAFQVTALAAGVHRAEAAAVPEIAHTTFTLDNGLEVIVHRDPSTPIAHVELWYKVGSKDEEPGHTGFAHLFEHIMFQGTKHVAEDAHFRRLKEAGASNINGTTSFDRTNYYETVPSNQLELAMWLESSRMGFLLDRANFQETLDNQREVVKNERRQRVDNRPMGAVMEQQLESMFSAKHPYHHEVIGSMADLTAASLADVKSFFNRYYAPNNAVMVVAGDVDEKEVRELVETYFGPIPPGPAVVRPPVPAARLDRDVRIAMEAKVNLPTETMVWHTAPLFKPGDAEMDVIAAVLTHGKSSRLFQRLVYDLKIAQSVEAYQWSLMHAGMFHVQFTPMPGHALAELEKVVDEEIQRLAREPITDKELERVRNGIKTDFFSALEPLAGRASRLAHYRYFAGDAGFMARDLARYEAVTPASVQSYARSLLANKPRLVITVDPNPAAPIRGRLKSEAKR